MLVGGGDMIFQVDRLAVALATILALVRSFVRVDKHVALQIRLATELFGALTADMVLAFHRFALSGRLLKLRLHVIIIL